MKKFKQLFCNHLYLAHLDTKPYYSSVGDEFHDRRSYRYHMTCTRCDKRIEVIDKWANERRRIVLEGESDDQQ